MVIVSTSVASETIDTAMVSRIATAASGPPVNERGTASKANHRSTAIVPIETTTPASTHMTGMNHRLERTLADDAPLTPALYPTTRAVTPLASTARSTSNPPDRPGARTGSARREPDRGGSRHQHTVGVLGPYFEPDHVVVDGAHDALERVVPLGQGGAAVLPRQGQHPTTRAGPLRDVLA